MSTNFRLSTICYSWLLDEKTPDFIPPVLWPHNLPDRNPVPQKCVYRTKTSDINVPKQRINSE